jgi:hypothetical protein
MTALWQHLTAGKGIMQLSKVDYYADIFVYPPLAVTLAVAAWRGPHSSFHLGGWHDLKFFVGRINFEQLGAPRASALNSIPTRFRLSQEQVGTLISAGQDALRTNAMFHAFLNSIRGKLLTAASSATR